ncbi:hypothetical protein BOM23_14240 [Erwinia sp. OLMDLW33]|nr:hypothetical protein BOM23_14240 [Erwinia sp. OLMDLW33]
MAINRPPVNTDASASYIAGLVAVVGCDGTGKSTLTADLVKNMQARGMSERRYLGVLSGEDGDKIKRLPIIGVWLERRLAKKSSETQRMSSKAPPLWAALIMYAFSLRRMANLRKVRRLTKRGVLVISDRYPQAEVSGFYYDGPGIGIERVSSGWMTYLAERERRLYQKMANCRPELVIRLDIDIETALARKPDHDYEELRDKISVMQKINYNHARIFVLDSRAPYNSVLSEALKLVSSVAEHTHLKKALSE